MRDTPLNHYRASTARDSWLYVPWDIGCILYCVSKPSSGRRLHEAETGSRLTNVSCVMSLNFQPRRAKHHAKRYCRCRSAYSARSVTRLDFRRFLTVFVDRRILGSQCCLSTGLVTNGIRLTKRCNVLSSRSYITRGLPDLGNSFTLLVCVCFITSRLTTAVW